MYIAEAAQQFQPRTQSLNATEEIWTLLLQKHWLLCLELTEDPMTAEQSKQKPSKTILKAIYTVQVPRKKKKNNQNPKPYPSNKGKQLETLQRNDLPV